MGYIPLHEGEYIADGVSGGEDSACLLYEDGTGETIAATFADAQCGTEDGKEVPGLSI